MRDPATVKTRLALLAHLSGLPIPSHEGDGSIAARVEAEVAAGGINCSTCQSDVRCRAGDCQGLRIRSSQDVFTPSSGNEMPAELLVAIYEREGQASAVRAQHQVW